MLGLNKNFDESQPHQVNIGGAQLSWAGQAQGGLPIREALVMSGYGQPTQMPLPFFGRLYEVTLIKNSIEF